VSTAEGFDVGKSGIPFHRGMESRVQTTLAASQHLRCECDRLAIPCRRTMDEVFVVEVPAGECVRNGTGRGRFGVVGAKNGRKKRIVKNSQPGLGETGEDASGIEYRMTVTFIRTWKNRSAMAVVCT